MRRATLVASVVFVSGAAVVLAQDAAKVDPAHYKVLVDNPSVRVLEVNYAPGAKSVMHHHPASMVVPLTTSKVQFTNQDGTSHTDTLAKDTAVYLPPDTHTPANVGTTPAHAIVVEFKAAAPGTATVPTARPGMEIKTVAEGPYATAYTSIMGPDFGEPAGTKHDFDQVVITLEPASISLSVDGKPAKTQWKRGDVQFIGRGVEHQSKNSGGKPVQVMIVAVK